MRTAKVVVFLACLVPFGMLAWRATHDGLGPDPITFVTHATGDWTLRFLVLTLAVTPLRKTLGLPKLVRFRRMLGLYAFFYGSLHFLTYVALDHFFDFSAMIRDVQKRTFITAGFTAFVLLIPLALTSTAGWIRRLGGREWQMLHRLIDISAACGALHYYWLVKSDIRLPFFYASMVALLLAWRAVEHRRSRPARQQRGAAAA